MKTKKVNNKTIRILGNILTIMVIMLIVIISFIGINVKDKNQVKNLIPKFKLGMDLKGSRNIQIKVDDSKVTKKYDKDGKIVTDNTENKDIKEVEEAINDSKLLNSENYKDVVKIIEDRFKYLKINNYLIRCNESNGDINVEVPENLDTDYIAQYLVTRGKFELKDSKTSEVFMTNDDLKKVEVKYLPEQTGVTVYLNIEFNEDAKNKLKELSNNYKTIEKKDEEVKEDENKESKENTEKENEQKEEEQKKIKIMVDDSVLIETSFAEEIDNGIISLSIGKSSDSHELENSMRQASNVAVLLNTKPMPIIYKMEANRFVFSDIVENNIKGIIIIFSIIFSIMSIYMIVKYKLNGFKGIIVNLGFIGILLLALRYGNVEINLAGIIMIAVSSVIEYIIIMRLLKEFNTQNNKELLKKNIKKLSSNIVIELIPLTIMSIVFALINWEEISVIGMVLFWSIIIGLIYNRIILGLKMFNSKKID